MPNLLRPIVERCVYQLMPKHLTRYVPQGLDLLLDIAKQNIEYQPTVVFDVGANIGQTVLKWRRYFPKAQYHCFEPVTDSFDALNAATSGMQNVTCHRFALGASVGTERIQIHSKSTMNSIVDARSLSVANQCEVIHVDMVDNFCNSLKIERIDVLKIDTEGFDLEVLKGAAGMLKSQSVDLIQCEAGMNLFNERHVPFTDVANFLQNFGYSLFGIYEQQLEWSGPQRLRFANPVFISEKMAVSRFK
ncbi:MAG: FkbM family methyltransferase [Hydrogenophaga sp.]|uniref:FkbM family methyltransferase n=1 Tax=Hydrogenophaga sp. TaxID=1904254 RepID=UPI0027365857|nr:FkbM family methyltransferase [Hydrogenophaga sp.]MDP3350561.1 FkbM family methyltransferase [Hydrogenophaga sp.]